jgi:hypothetical protein
MKFRYVGFLLNVFNIDNSIFGDTPCPDPDNALQSPDNSGQRLTTPDNA